MTRQAASNQGCRVAILRLAAIFIAVAILGLMAMFVLALLRAGPLPDVSPTPTAVYGAPAITGTLNLPGASASLGPDTTAPAATPSSDAPASQGTPAPGSTPPASTGSAANPGASAQVSADGAGLRLRRAPGPTGQVITLLEALTPLTVVGRTTQTDWLQVTTPDGLTGWVTAQFVDTAASLENIPVTGQALDAPARGTAEAQVSSDGGGLRLRASPGNAGEVLTLLDAYAPLTLVGRTADGVWLQVSLADGTSGWVMAQYVDVSHDLSELPVTGVAINATPSTSDATAAPQSTPAYTNTPQQADTPTPGPTSRVTPTPPAAAVTLTPRTHVYGITARAREVFLQGQQLGNRPNVFSKVGDSITVSPQFLSPIGLGEYNLRQYTYLAAVIQYFSTSSARDSNSFANTSLAARGGWSSWTVINPYFKHSALCAPGETPLACEYRLVRPAAAVIMLGTNDVSATPGDVFKSQMRQVVELSIQNGVVPILSSIPPFQRPGLEARPAELNAIIAALAQEYDIPWMDYWAALQGLPNQGMSPDGIHPSWADNPSDFSADSLRSGYTMRNLLTLEILDAVWRGALY